MTTEAKRVTRAQIAAELGVSVRTAYRRMASANAYDELPADFQRRVDSRELTLLNACREFLGLDHKGRHLVTCRVCRNEVVGMRPNRRYCSDACRMRAYRKRKATKK